MSEADPSTTLTERQAREVELFCQIAKENGSVMTLGELRELVGLDPKGAGEHELESAFLSDSNLRSRFLLDSGYVLERSAVAGTSVRRAVVEEEARRESARTNLRRARRFGEALRRSTVLVSVSGANAYLSAAEDDDVDFFCVTKTNGMWLFMLKALVLARLHRIASGDAPELCLSCIMDESWATRAFKTRQGSIFARDALTARVIGGREAYGALLEEGRWMAGYFPVLYAMRLCESDPDERRLARDGADGRSGSTVLNLFLYRTLGSFLRLKSWGLNRKLTKASRHSSIFATRFGTGHYIYESNRYRRLRGIYGELEKDG